MESSASHTVEPLGPPPAGVRQCSGAWGTQGAQHAASGGGEGRGGLTRLSLAWSVFWGEDENSTAEPGGLWVPQQRSRHNRPVWNIRTKCYLWKKYPFKPACCNLLLKSCFYEGRGRDSCALNGSQRGWCGGGGGGSKALEPGLTLNPDSSSSVRALMNGWDWPPATGHADPPQASRAVAPTVCLFLHAECSLMAAPPGGSWEVHGHPCSRLAQCRGSVSLPFLSLSFRCLLSTVKGRN